MVTVPTHFRFSIRGIFGDTPEGWNYGFHFNRSVAASADAGLSDIDEAAVSSALATFHAQTFFSMLSILTEWRAYVIGTNGKMEGNGPLLHEYGTPVPGGSSGSFFPPQVALAVTTVADNRGPAERGRFYLPGVRLTPAADMRISEAEADTITDATVDMLKGISAAIDMPATIESSAAANVSGLPVGTGTKQDIDHLETGRVYDTIRSRRRSLLEERFVGGQIDW